MLAASFDLKLVNIAEFTDPQSSQGGTTQPTYIDLILHIDPSFMLYTVAFVIGASRMPVAPFTVMVIGAWILHVIVGARAAWQPTPVGSFALQIDAASTLLVLYGARAWRPYAAAIGSSSAAGFTDMPERQLAYNISCPAAVMVTILLSGFAPAIAPS